MSSPQTTSQPASPTPYVDVNAALAELLTAIQKALAARLVGVYLGGSLALGDFDPAHSDIDLIVATDGALGDAEVAALRSLHARFDASSSPWAGKVEVVYAPRVALADPAAALLAADPVVVPQVEKERGLVLDRLEDGWLALCWVLREHGATLAGPAPHTLVGPIDPAAMRITLARIPHMWQEDAHSDPTWLAWLAVRQTQAFVVLTLCRLLYTLATGAVVSKPAAARWAEGALGAPWTGLIQRARAEQHSDAVTPAADITATVALVEFAVQRFDQLPAP